MSWRQWRARLAVLYHPDESPRKTALALAIGVFLSFTPFWGFQTLLALLLATVFLWTASNFLASVSARFPFAAPLPQDCIHGQY